MVSVLVPLIFWLRFQMQTRKRNKKLKNKKRNIAVKRGLYCSKYLICVFRDVFIEYKIYYLTYVIYAIYVFHQISIFSDASLTDESKNLELRYKQGYHSVLLKSSYSDQKCLKD